MKTKVYLIFILSILLASCSSLQQSAVNDDIYYSPKDEVVASNDTYANPTYDNTKSTLFGKEYDEKISEILEDDSKEVIDTTVYESEEYENPYENVLVDNYDEAYQRRLDARNSPYYGMNNYFVTFSDAYWYASAYDPYFYNIIVVGDQVWVEPRYITSSFGYSFGYRPYSHYNWGFYSPYYYRSYYYDPFYSSYYSPYHSYYSPYYSNYHGYYHPYSDNKNYVSSSFHSYRQRSLTSRSSAGAVSGRSARELPETYMGRNVTRSSTVKSGLDKQTVRTTRSRDVANTRTTTSRDISRTNTSMTRERTGTSTRTGTDNVRSQNTTSSTYNRSTRTSSTRYNRPSSTSTDRSRSSSGTTRTSTYSPNRSSTSRSGSGNSSVGRSSTRSSGNSGSVRSSGSSGSSGSSSRSSGSSKSSSSSSRNGGRR